jgi:hypothetical protein
MAVYQPIWEEKRSPNAGTTELAHTSDCMTPVYIINLVRLRLICYLQLALHWI